MMIDIIFCVLLVMAIFKGYSKGFIVALFSLVAYIIGLAAAMKLSAVVAKYLQSSWDINGRLLPILSFVLVLVGVMILVRLTAGFIKKAVSLVFLGWLDKLGGILLFALLYLFIYSVILFYASQIHLISEEKKKASATYSYLAPLGPKVIDGLGVVIPFFSDMFTDLQKFFEGIAKEKEGAATSYFYKLTDPSS
jgi:membrane protein required for colicin V production